MHADDRGITVLNLETLAPPDDRKGLREMETGTRRPAAAARGDRHPRPARGRTFVFADGRKVIDLDDLLFGGGRYVLQIKPAREARLKWGALAGGIAGFVAGAKSASRSLQACGKNCDDEKVLMALSFIGLRSTRALGIRPTSHGSNHRIRAEP